VKNLIEAISIYEKKLQIKSSKIEFISSQNINRVFFILGDVKLELIESLDVNSSINKFLENKKSKIHHIALEVDNIEKDLNSFNAPLEAPKKIEDNSKIVFINPQEFNGILFELVEKS
jgi:methylmalonyl-CoA epimerase